MSVYETSITNPKKQVEFYKDLSEQLESENKELKKQLKIKQDGFMASVEESCELAEENQKYKELIDYLKSSVKMTSDFRKDEEDDDMFYLGKIRAYEDILSKIEKR